MHCTIKLLGWLRVEQRDRLITRFRTRQTGALLAYLALYADRPHSRDSLVDLLWPDDDRDAARHKLRLALSSLRQQLEPPDVPAGAVIIADRLSVRLDASMVTTDVASFESAVREAGRVRSELEQACLLTQAAEQYEGELLPGFFDAWIIPERQRLAETHAHALHQLVRLSAEQGDLAGGIRWAQRAVGADPLREEAHYELIRLLDAAGQQDAALRQFKELEQLLARELGAAPAEETRDLVRSYGRHSGGSPPADREAGSSARGSELDGTAQQANTPIAPFSEYRVTEETPISGTITLLLAETSSPEAPQSTGAPQPPVTDQRARLRRAFERYRGRIVREAGHSLLAAFARASDALAGAVAGQETATFLPDGEGRGASREKAPGGVASASPSPTPAPFLARMALHSGEIALEAEVDGSLAFDHTVRVLLATHPGQILCTEATAVLLRGSVEPGMSGFQLSDLGIYRFRDPASDAPLPERLFQVLYPDMPHRDFPPPKAAPAYPGHLPIQLTRFFGREEEVTHLCGVLEQTAEHRDSYPSGSANLPAPPLARLVTLTGPGGSGKTRLAIEVAARLRRPFYGAAWFVPLADLSRADVIPEAILNALRIPRTADYAPLDQVVNALAHHPALLVLDNFEHLVEAGALIVRTLLERAPLLTCLVTSRQVLDLTGEHEFAVQPLPVPPLPAPAEGAKLRDHRRRSVPRPPLSTLHSPRWRHAPACSSLSTARRWHGQTSR